jgi:hypothetical protein
MTELVPEKGDCRFDTPQSLFDPQRAIMRRDDDGEAFHTNLQ